MNKEQQDKLWNELSEEKQKSARGMYKLLTRPLDPAKSNAQTESDVMSFALETTFGSHNLNPEPQIKTWEDVEKQQNIDCNFYTKDDLNEYLCLEGWDVFGDDNKLVNKLQATLKISKLIELGYGGMVSEEEWKEYKDSLYTYYSIVCRDNGTILIEFVDAESAINRNFLTFHSKELAEEFMSHESNRKLVEQYYLL